MSFKMISDQDLDLLRVCNERFFLNILLFNKYLDMRVISSDKTEEFFRLEIVKEIIITALLWIKEKKELTYKDFVIFSKIILKKYLNARINDSFLEIKINNKTRRDFIIAGIEDDLYNIFQMIDFTDAVDIVNGNVEDVLDLEEHMEPIRVAKKKFYKQWTFKRAFYYKGKIPLILKSDNHYSLIMFCNNKYLAENPECDISICLKILLFKKSFPDAPINNIIVYDTENNKRYIFKYFVNYERNSLENLFNILFMLDCSTHIKTHGNHCYTCLNRGICYLSNLNPKDRFELYKSNKDSVNHVGKSQYYKYNKSIKENKELYQYYTGDN